MNKIKKTVQKKMNDSERIAFAKQIEDLYEAGHTNMKRVMGLAFLKGIATGLGVFLGGTLVVALLLWTLSQASNLPFIGDISKAAEQSINKSKANEQ